MKKYLLLRNNRQSGPHSFEEMTALLLNTKDLVWIEHESTAWSFPGEISELKDFVEEHQKPSSNILASIPDSSSTKFSQDAERISLPEDDLILETNICQPLSELKERLDDFPQKKSLWQGAGLSSAQEAIKLAAVFSALVVGAFLMKKMVDEFDQPSLSEASVPASIIAEEPTNANNYNNALFTEIVPGKNLEKPVKKARPKDLRKQLSLKASDYKVGVIGGISNLDLKIFNGSPHSIDKVMVAVQYLKPNGTVIQTDNFEIQSLKPYGSKLLNVPDSKRGMKIKYKIVEVQSKDYTKAIKEV